MENMFLFEMKQNCSKAMILKQKIISIGTNNRGGLKMVQFFYFVMIEKKTFQKFKEWF